MDDLHYFVFKGIDSRRFGVAYISSLPQIAERGFKTTEIPGREEPLNRLEVTRRNIKLPITLRLLSLDKVDYICAWLQGEGDLILSTDPDKVYHACVNGPISPVRMSRRFGNFPVVFTAEPFRYSLFNPVSEIEMSLDDNNLVGRETIHVRGTADCEPLLYFEVAGKLQMYVNGEYPLTITTPGSYDNSILLDGRYFRYKYTTQSIYVDCAAKLAYFINDNDKKVVVNDKTSGMFPKFRHGDNTVSFRLMNDVIVYEGEQYTPRGQKLTVFRHQNNERWY